MLKVIIIVNNNRWHGLALMVAGLLALAAADGHTSGRPGPAGGKAADERLATASDKTTTTGAPVSIQVTGPPAGEHKSAGPSEEENSQPMDNHDGLTGESRSSRGTPTETHPVDRNFAGPGIIVGPGRVLVHAVPLLRASLHESEYGLKSGTWHTLFVDWPAWGNFDDTKVVSYVTYKRIGYSVSGSLSTMFLLATSQFHRKDIYPSPDQLPAIHYLDDVPGEDCFVYAWSDESECSKRPHGRRQFVKMAVEMNECCEYMCDLKITDGAGGLCFGQADLGSPVLCKGKLSYIVTRIPTWHNTEIKTFEAHKMSDIANLLNRTVSHTGDWSDTPKTAKRGPTGPNQKSTSTKKQAKKGANKKTPQRREKPKMRKKLAPAKS